MSEIELVFNPFAPGHAENPYRQYQMMREGDPVHENPFGWAVFGYDDVRTLLRDQTLSVDEGNMHSTVFSEMMAAELGDDIADFGNTSMLNVDPPNHTRLRRLVAKAFTPRMIERLRDRVQALVDDMLDAAAQAGGMELMDEMAFQLPFTVITELLGMPPTDTHELRRLSGTIVRSLEPVADAETIREIAAAGLGMREIITAAIEWKRPRLEDDLLSGLIAAEEGGDKLSSEELADQVALLYIAGHETTVNLIGNGVLALLRHPDQLELMRSDVALGPEAIDELLRYDSPVQMTRRIPTAELEIGGQTIEAGAFVLLGLASANRDQAKWGDDADRLSLRRPDAGDHVSFGGGHHHCLGAALARLEGQVAITSLVRRFPKIEIAGEPSYNGRLNLRGLSSLPLAFA